MHKKEKIDWFNNAEITCISHEGEGERYIFPIKGFRAVVLSEELCFRVLGDVDQVKAPEANQDVTEE